MKSLVSIIIPTYKPDIFFKECLSSISVQTYKYFELIIVLNGCNEPYYSNIKAWLNEYNLSDKTKLIQTETSGVSNARNIGIEKSTGQYVCFIDDDDAISSDYLENLQKVAKPQGIVFSNIAFYWDDIKNATYENPFSKAFCQLSSDKSCNLFRLRKLLNGPWGKLYPRELIGTTRFINTLSHGEDAMFNFELSRKIKYFIFTPVDTTYYYRINPNGATLKKHNAIFYINSLLRKGGVRMKIYLTHPFDYNIPLLISRYLADYKMLYQQLSNK